MYDVSLILYYINMNINIHADTPKVSTDGEITN